MRLWESGVHDKNEEEKSDESELGAGVVAYLVWTAVSSAIEQEMGRLAAAAPQPSAQRQDVCLYSSHMFTQVLN